jgi:glycosyltransferase involved in cell wall biosynthesis
LNRGGVTQVIINQLRALDLALQTERPWRVALVSSGRRVDWPEQLLDQVGSVRLDMIEIPALDYDRNTTASPGELARQIREGLRGRGYSADDTILHVHNHSLGKNLSLPGAIRILACDGFRLLLQIHDFAEDYRHDNYARMTAALATMTTDGADDLASVLYPQADHIHYATLNRRDWSILRDAGVPVSLLHLLPNPVPELATLTARADARVRLAQVSGVPVESPFVLYPVRGIRRKNLGESLLWSALIDGSWHFGFTLPPMNPIEQPSYIRWKQLAGELRLPCHFELGTLPEMTLTDLLAAADLMLTTSVAEGFGMVFLESWLAGRSLVGRDLPEISADFVTAGLRLSGLQPRLSVPLEWVSRRTFYETLTSLYASCLQSFGQSAADSTTLAAQVKELVSDGTVDFAMLDPALQSRVIGRVRDDQSGKRRLLDLNQWMEHSLNLSRASSAEDIQQNAEAVRRAYALDAFGPRLRDLYRAIAGSPRSDRLKSLTQPRQVLNTFLHLKRFCPIRVLP